MVTIEQTIFKALLYSENFVRKVVPYLEEEYFDGYQRTLFKVYKRLFDKYNSIPTLEALAVTLQNEPIGESEFSDIVELIDDTYKEKDDLPDIDWLIDETEQYCRDKKIYNAIYESINIIEGSNTKLDKHAIPILLDEALAVSFDQTIGMEFFDDAEKRHEIYTNEDARIKFPLEALNYLSNGGHKKKALSCILAFCVHPDTEVTIRKRLRDSIYEFSKPFIAYIKEIEPLLKNHEVVVDSPDGWVDVQEYVKKGGDHEEYKVSCGDSSIRTNQHHRIETKDGWKSVKDILPSDLIFTKNGYEKCIVERTGNLIDIVDIVVDHPNHRYWTGNISSHNTNVGKSSLMCFLAGEFLKQGKNVLYITMEMGEEDVHQRVEANVFGHTTNEIVKLSREKYHERIQKVKSKTNGRLFVKQFPTGSAHAGHFRHLLRELKQKKKVDFDFVFVDYLNICASSRYKSMSGVNSYSYVKAIAEELRGLAIEFDLPIMTATQTNREGANDQSPDMTATSDSIGTPMSMDWMIAVTQDEILAENNQQLIHLLKTRWGSKKKMKSQLVGVNWDLMRYYDVGSTKEVTNQVGNKKPETKERNLNDIEWD